MYTSNTARHLGPVYKARTIFSILVAPSLLFYRSSMLTEDGTALLLCLSYSLTLCILFYVSYRGGWVELKAGCLLALWLVIALGINARIPPITLGVVKSWLNQELKPGSDKNAILAFIAKHSSYPRTIAISSFNRDSYIDVTYYSRQPYACWHVTISFKLNAARRLLSYDVYEESDCP